MCNFSGTRVVRYGASNMYHYGVYSKTVYCSNGVFGGDPISGKYKSCNYYNGSNGYTPCVNEGQTCVFPTGKTVSVRYGANGKWKSKTTQGSITCSNSVFGDPNYGVRKYCKYYIIS